MASKLDWMICLGGWIVVACLLLGGCASRYQPPGEDIWAGLKHLEQQRNHEQ